MYFLERKTAFLFETRKRFIRSANTSGNVLIDVSDVRHDRCTRHFHSYRKLFGSSQMRASDARGTRGYHDIGSLRSRKIPRVLVLRKRPFTLHFSSFRRCLLSRKGSRRNSSKLLHKTHFIKKKREISTFHNSNTTEILRRKPRRNICDIN